MFKKIAIAVLIICLLPIVLYSGFVLGTILLAAIILGL